MSTNQNQPQDLPERRGIDGIALQIMGEVRKIFNEHEKHEAATFKSMENNIKQNNENSNVRHEQLIKRFEETQKETLAAIHATNTTTNEIHKMFKAAFPEGDFDAHRKAHEHWIEKDKSEKAFWLKLKEDVIKLAFVSFAGWASVILWAAFLKGPN